MDECIMFLYACICVGLIIYLIKDICKRIRIQREFGEAIDKCEEAIKEVEKKQKEHRKAD